MMLGEDEIWELLKGGQPAEVTEDEGDLPFALGLLQRAQEVFLELLCKNVRTHVTRRVWKAAKELETDVEVFLEQFPE